MSEPKRPVEQEDPPDAFQRFQKLARALFRVDKRDVPKHEPKKRGAALVSSSPNTDGRG